MRRRCRFPILPFAILAFFTLIAVWAAIPKYRMTESYRNETVAIFAIQSIHKAEVRYQSQNGPFAPSLTDLLPFLTPPDLARGLNQGYAFSLTVTATGYVIRANPVAYGETGNRTFYSDETMVIRENYGPEPAIATSPPIR